MHGENALIAKQLAPNVLFVKKTTIQLFDDLSGDVISEGNGRTVEFSLDGDAFEIDLSDHNISALREALAPYIAAGRAAGRGRAPRAANRSASASGLSSEQLAAVRSWAAENGYPVSDRGRIAASIREAYDAAH